VHHHVVLDIAEEIRSRFPAQKRSCPVSLRNLIDDAAEDEDMLQVARYMLESVAVGKPQAVDKLMGRLVSLLQEQLQLREKTKAVVEAAAAGQGHGYEQGRGYVEYHRVAEGATSIRSTRESKCILFWSVCCWCGTRWFVRRRA